MRHGVRHGVRAPHGAVVHASLSGQGGAFFQRSQSVCVCLRAYLSETLRGASLSLWGGAAISSH